MLPVNMVGKLLGVEFSFEQIINTLTSLGFTCTPNESKTEITAVAPYWRSDIKLPVDLVEEVGRIIGYDKIPLTMLSEPIPPQNPEPIIGLKRQVRQSLVSYGFQELVSFSLISGDWLNKLQPEPKETESPR